MSELRMCWIKGLTGFFGFKVYPVNLSESEFTELKNLHNGSKVFYSVNSKIQQILIQTIIQS